MCLHANDLSWAMRLTGAHHSLTWQHPSFVSYGWWCLKSLPIFDLFRSKGIHQSMSCPQKLIRESEWTGGVRLISGWVSILFDCSIWFDTVSPIGYQRAICFDHSRFNSTYHLTVMNLQNMWEYWSWTKSPSMMLFTRLQHWLNSLNYALLLWILLFKVLFYCSLI